ncbi:phosphoglycerate mutase [Lactarius hengduanensis]|nr:phosphoglycerate mutase [Lactarius hengduanensis]
MSDSVIVTFIRHAQSTDNKTSMWTGWKDAPLSKHGMDQARALGESFVDTHFTAIYTSDLKRASSTAQVLYDHQKDPKPSFNSSELLREQNFGLATGKYSLFPANPALTFQENAAMGAYPDCYSDDDRFPEGESLKDVAKRGKIALTKFVLPHVWQAAKEGKTGIHVAIVSHGLCISELISELLEMGANRSRRDIHNLSNTGWTRVVINTEGAQEGQPKDVDKELPVLVMRITDVNYNKHTY